MGVAHALGQGTDAGQAWFLALVAIALLPRTPTPTPDMRGQS